MLGDLLSKFGLTNILGTVTAAIGAVIGVMDWLGCHPGVEAMQATCQLPTWFPVSWVPVAIFATGAAALIAKLLRPGTIGRNLFGGTAVIVPKEVIDTMKTGTGVVTPAQVAQK